MNRQTIISMITGALILLLTMPAFAALSVGTRAPDFTAPASLAGQPFTFSLENALAKGPVVVYFYPAAFTRGCDLEAHTFATRKAEFEAAGATIIGVSADSIERLNDFSSDPGYCAGQFPVASDPQGRIAARYDLPMKAPRAGVTDTRGDTVSHGFLPRTTFVLDGNGKIVARWSSKEDDLTPIEHVTHSLAIVQKLHAQSDQ